MKRPLEIISRTCDIYGISRQGKEEKLWEEI